MMHRTRLTAVLLAMTAIPAVAVAQPRVFDVQKLFDGEQVIEQARMVIDNGRVVAVGPRDQVAVPPEAGAVTPLTYVIPGLISAHSHVGMVNGVNAGGQNYRPEVVSKDLAQFQRFGVVAVNALGMNDTAFYALRQSSPTRAQTEATLFGAGGGVGAAEGAPPSAMNPPGDLQRAGTPQEARAAVRHFAAQGVDMIKVWVDDLNGSVPRMTPDVYAAAIEEAHAQNLKVAAHIHDLEDAKGVLKAGADIIGHGVRDVPVDDEFIALLKQRDAWYIPTVNINEAEYIYAENPQWLNDPFFRRALNPALEARLRDREWRAQALSNADAPKRAVAMNIANLRVLHQAGIKIGFGTDAGATPLRIPGFAEHLELAHLVEAGMTPVEALKVATSQSARLIGQEDRGCLRVGCRADFLVLQNDATTDITASRSLTSVWRDGMQTTPQR